MSMKDTHKEMKLVNRIAKNVLTLSNTINNNLIVINIDDGSKGIARIIIDIKYLDDNND